MKITPNQMCFGLTEELDRTSFNCFLQQVGRDEFAQELAARATRQEIETFVTQFTSLMQKHFSENEYHRLFLGDHTHHNHKEK